MLTPVTRDELTQKRKTPQVTISGKHRILIVAELWKPSAAENWYRIWKRRPGTIATIKL
jgi:hypothetical protein